VVEVRRRDHLAAMRAKKRARLVKRKPARWAGVSLSSKTRGEDGGLVRKKTGRAMLGD
jgi:hypothetical protein